MAGEEVARNQRGRIIGAMIEAVHRGSYGRTTVADVIELAGVSRRAFYEQFANRQDCFLAAHDIVVARARRHALDAWQRERDSSRRMRAAWEAVLEGVARSPRGPRLALLSAPDGGAEAHLRIQLAELAFERLLVAGLAAAPDRARVPALAPRAIVGGVRRVIWRRLRDRSEHQLPGLTAELLDWAGSYGVVPAPAPAPPSPAGPVGSPPPAVAGKRREQGERELVLQATLALAARAGYEGLCERRIAHLAGVSVRRFHACFPNARAAFLAARQELACAAIAHARAKARSAGSWPEAVRLALAGFVERLLRADGLARILFVEPYAAGGGAAALIAAPVDELAGLLLAGAPPPRLGPAVAAEAVRGALCSLLASRLPAGRPRRVDGLCDQLAFIVLAPYLGPGAALGASRGFGAAAWSGRGRGSRAPAGQGRAPARTGSAPLAASRAPAASA